MSLRAKDHGQMSRRTASGVTQRFLWTLIAMGSVSALGIATATGLTHVRLPQIASYTGHLEDTAQTLTLNLPRGVAVDQLMTREGARARKGQTLVWLNAASISTAIRQAEATIAADQQLLVCLQDSALAKMPLHLVVVAAPSIRSKEVGPSFSAAATLDCTQHAAMHSGPLEALASNDAILALRSMLIDRRIKLELAHLSAMQVGRDSRARLVLGLAWEQTRIEESRAVNQERRREITNEASAATSAHIRQVIAALYQNEAELAILKRLEQDPRLSSPVDAIILEAHATTPGQLFGETTPLINMVPIGPQRFEVKLAVPVTQLHVLRENAIVQIELIGTAMRWPSLTGHVTGVEHGDPQDYDSTLHVRIGLEPESAAALAEMSARSGFIGDGAAITVQAIVPEQPAATALVKVWEETATFRAIGP